jgi:hypothetical protein
MNDEKGRREMQIAPFLPKQTELDHECSHALARQNLALSEISDVSQK